MGKCTCTDRNYAAGEHDHTYVDMENGNYLCDSCDGFVDYPDYDPDEPDGEDEAADQYNYERQNGDFETF